MTLTYDSHLRLSLMTLTLSLETLTLSLETLTLLLYNPMIETSRYNPRVTFNDFLHVFRRQRAKICLKRINWRERFSPPFTYT